MKIKDIRHFRSFYKTTRPVSPELEEHFVGNFYLDRESRKKRYGWFAIYHGDKDGFKAPEAGIENFLQSFLDMAKDGQAVYEFLQNAVDAGSSHYSMFWGKDEVDGHHYLLVANNGSMFDLNSVRSILNVGASTKNSDSHTIGKFGIGFKLAHRLVGKDNGLQELINEHSGPILFSWKNYEIDQLAEAVHVEPVQARYEEDEEGNHFVSDDHPWLFKILITCFPCLPENDLVSELPIMTNGKAAITSPFSRAEYEVLARWVNNYRHVLSRDQYNEGSLFFIRLGTGKEEELSEVNLKDGVKFAIAILKETAHEDERAQKILHTVQLNDGDAITYPDLEYIRIHIDKVEEKDTYAHIRFGVDAWNQLNTEQRRKVEDEGNIEALFGFKKYDETGNFFEGAPNLYLYFPLSEEVHNFNYILHSNAFYKGSSRTFLHRGNSKEDGINERLLKVIVQKIQEKLQQLSASADMTERSLFLHFYAALLTSGKSSSQARVWIEKPYIDPVNELLRKHIPVQSSATGEAFKVVSDRKKVFIKRTAVAVDPETWGIPDVYWYYWPVKDTVLTIAGKSKLEIAEFTFLDLLEKEGVEDAINAWSNGEDSKIRLLLRELSSLSVDKKIAAAIRPRLVNLNLFRFSNGELLSLEAFLKKEKDGYFLIHNTLNSVQDLLQKVGLITTVLDLDEFKFMDIYRSHFLQSSKHGGYTALTQLFSQCVSDRHLLKLSRSEKLRLFHAFRTLNSDTVTERIKELKLFSNNLGRPMPFRTLLTSQSSGWLNLFSIADSEYDEQVKPFLAANLQEYYQQVVYPFWNDILQYISRNSHKVHEVVTGIQDAFNKSTWLQKQQHLLSNQQLIVYKGEVITTQSLFFHKVLALVQEDVFGRLQEVCMQCYNVHVPDRSLIDHLALSPLGYTPVNIDKAIPDMPATLQQLNDLMQLSALCNIDLFAHNCIGEENGAYAIVAASGLQQFNTTNPQVEKYIQQYHPGQFVLIPQAIEVGESKLHLSGSALVYHLITLYDKDNAGQEMDLTAIVLTESYEIKKKLLDVLPVIQLDAAWKEDRANSLYLKLLNEVIMATEADPAQNDLKRIQQKVKIGKDGLVFRLDDIDSAQDTIPVQRDKIMIPLSQSRILNIEGAGNIRLVQELHDAAVSRDLIQAAKAQRLFKIAHMGATAELKAKFLEKVSDKQLVNSHQILFVLLSGLFTQEELPSFKVKGMDGEWYLLADTSVCNTSNAGYIHSSYILSSDYDDLQGLLQLSDQEIFYFGDKENYNICSRFLFVRGIDPGILIGDKTIPEKLDYLNEGWIKVQGHMRVQKKSADWDTYLGIHPSHYMLEGIRTSGEVLPEAFVTWTGKDHSKQELLEAIGVHPAGSTIQTFRSYMSGQSDNCPAEADVSQLDTMLLLHTLQGLAGDFVELKGVPFVYQDTLHKGQLSFTEKIILNLTKQEIGCPLLVYAGAGSYKLVKLSDNTVYRLERDLQQKLQLYAENHLEKAYTAWCILKESLLIDTLIRDKVPELIYSKVFVPLPDVTPHNEPFYHSWSREHRIVLQKQAVLQYDVLADRDGESIYLGRITEGYYDVSVSAEGGTILSYVKSIQLEGLMQFLSAGHRELAASLSDLLRKKDEMLARVYNAYNAAGKDDVNAEHLQALQQIFKEEDLRAEREGYVETLSEGTKYSYEWFLAYLNYLHTFSGNKADNNKPKTIRFRSIRRQMVNGRLSDKYFLLSGSSSYISDWIEEISDFKLSVTLKNHQKIDVGVEGAQKRGQDLIIYCPRQVPKELTDQLDQVFQAEIIFVAKMDLLQELRTAFSNDRFIRPWEDVQAVLPNLHFVYGPPGTGKTTTLCTKIISEISKDPAARILFLTPTNKAADVLCKKLLLCDRSGNDHVGTQMNALEAAGNTLRIHRIGKPTDPDLEALDTLYQGQVDSHLIRMANVIAMTVHRLPYMNVFDAYDDEEPEIRLFRLKDHWDYLILDEASMIHLPYLVFAVMAVTQCNPAVKVIIAGDPKQIPPVIDANDQQLENLNIQDENVYTMLNIQDFHLEGQPLRIHDTIEYLNTQYRSVSRIGHLFSDLSYNGLLAHHRTDGISPARALPEKCRTLFSDHVLFIDVPLDRNDSVFRIRKLMYSSYHLYSALLVAELVKYFASQLPEKEKWTIGLVAPYKAQAILLSKLIDALNLSGDVKLYADTVHGFQGDECDMVFFIVNPNRDEYNDHYKSLLSKEYIYNVAISRARDQLIVVHPLSTDNPYVHKLRDIYASRFGDPVIKKAADVEQALFGDHSYIAAHSYISGHDMVNIFGQPDMQYFIKANETAIDIQLRKFDAG